MSVSKMGLLKFLLLYTYTVLVHLTNLAESTVLVHFDRTPPAMSRYSYAIFRYSFQALNGSNACQNNICYIYCEIDGQTLSPCPANVLVLKNLTVNHEHRFLVNVTTSNGWRNSSTYSWLIDTMPPIATISTDKNYTNAKRVVVEFKFSEPCIGKGGLTCVNSSNCDVIIKGPGHVDASSLRAMEPNIKYKLDVVLSLRSIIGQVVITLANNVCADAAGNHFRRSNASNLVLHLDRRPVMVDLWTSVPSYVLTINGIPRTVLATNKVQDLKIFLDFSIPIMNSTEQVQSALYVNSGDLMPISSTSQANRRFGFELKNISGTEIITVKLRAHLLLIGRTGCPVSPTAPVTFLYDSIEPGVRLSTNSPNVTKESNINIIAEFTKPVFGFEASKVKVNGGKITRFNEISRALYSMTVQAVTQNIVSVSIPAAVKVHDISGNQNLASTTVEVKTYTTPVVSTALQSFMTAGVVATSLAATLISLSYANLGAIETLASGRTNLVASDSSMNLHGMIGHLQVFVLSDWLSSNQPIEFSETTKGLRWLIPHQKLPWEKDDTSVWSNHVNDMVNEKFITSSFRGLISNEVAELPFSPTNTSFTRPIQESFDPKTGLFHIHHNMSLRNNPYGQSLDSKEYFTYFLRGEPLSASNVVKRMENYKGWQDMEMNLFWLGVGGGGLVLLHVLTLLFLRWRTGIPAHSILSVPRFELFLIILTLPCISQSSMFVIKGGTTGGIITGALLLALPVAFILSVCVFLVIAVFSGILAQYKEVKHVDIKQPWYRKLLFFFTMNTAAGKWFYREGLASTFLPRFGILFESLKGPSLYIFVDQNDPNTIPKWIESGQNGIGRMRAIGSEDSNEEMRIPIVRRFIGCARSSYTALDLIRRFTLGIISAAYSSRCSSQTILALTITMIQFLYLFTFKPYIRRGVHLVETISLLCEIGFFGLSLTKTNKTNPIEAQNLGYIMLSLLFITFVSQITNEWYALINSLLRLAKPEKNSLKLGLKFAAKGLVLPFLPREYWSRIIAESSQPCTGLGSVLPLSQEIEMRATNADSISSMTATVVPVMSPAGSPGPGATYTKASTYAETSGGHGQGGGVEGKRVIIKGVKQEQKSELKKLRELARASFSGDSKVEEASTSYGN